MPKPTTAGILLLTGVTLLPAAMATGDEQPPGCASIVADEARLACYDATFGMPATNGAARSLERCATSGEPTVSDASSAAPAAGPAVTAAGASAASDAAIRAREDFGLSEVDRRARKPQEELEPDSITSTLARVGTRPTGELVLTLTDGQVWTQVQADTRFRARAGDAVTIRKATLGSYLMTGPERIATRVRRVK